jgi:SAM-dependent methyltransferase
MNDWTQGYVSDIEYLPGFYAEQTPAHLDTVCLLKGVEPPVTENEPFTYCELGCGVGETALAVAAANPHGEVWGFDFNPAHIARGRQLAALGKVGNIRLEESSFEQMASGQVGALPLFDYVTLHGVWSWVSVENRKYIVSFINRYLKPGGLVYVTYNALPRWSSVIPLQRMLSMFADLDPGSSDNRVLKSLDFVHKFAAAGAGMLPADMLERLNKERDNANSAYLSHEYLNEHWAPCFHKDVAGDLAAAKLNFVGSANLLENFPDVTLTPAQRDALADLPASMVETARDYFMERSFRRDVFIRGARKIPERRLEHRIRDKRLCLVIPPSATRRDIKVPLGEATLNEGFYQPALDALKQGPRTIGELLDLPDAEGSTASAREVLGMLVGSNQAMAMPNTPAKEAVAAARAYNTAHLPLCADDGRPVCALAAGGIGSAVTVRLFEMLAYEVLVAGTPAEAESVVAAMWELLVSRGDRLRHEGNVIEDDEENIRVLRENVADILAIALPMWQRIGAI